MNLSASERFDVVIVPDFSGRGRVTFEARTLYFLASWIEYSNVCGRVPLHIACIGEPPQTVRTLAGRCDAIISVHQSAPAELGIYANKLRGFEAPLQTERLLLLDADILVIGDLSELGRLAPEVIGATPSHHALLLPEMWAEYYARLGQPVPSQRMADFDLTLDIRRDAAIFPSFNGGVAFAPRRAPLRDRWEAHLRVLNEFRERWAPTLRSLDKLWGDEPALTSAIQQLGTEGFDVVELPDKFNGRWRHLYRRSPKLRDFALFHMTSSFGDGTTLREKTDPWRFAYERKLFRRYGKRLVRRSDSRLVDAIRYAVPATVELASLHSRLQYLYRTHVRDLVVRQRD